MTALSLAAVVARRGISASYRSHQSASVMRPATGSTYPPVALAFSTEAAWRSASRFKAKFFFLLCRAGVFQRTCHAVTPSGRVIFVTEAITPLPFLVRWVEAALRYGPRKPVALRPRC
jgi:hypothetical protein